MGNAHHEQHENVVSLVSCHDGKEKIGGFAKKIILGRKQHFWAQKGPLWAIGAEKRLPSAQAATYRKTKVIQSYLRIWGTYDRSGPVCLSRKNGGFISVA